MSHEKKILPPQKSAEDVSNRIKEIENRRDFSKKIIISYGLTPINPIKCGRQSCASSYSYGPALREFWLLHFVISGKGVLVNQSGMHAAKKDEVFVIRPHEETTYIADVEDPWEYVWIGFSSTLPIPQILKTQDVFSAPYLKPLFESAHKGIGDERGNTFGAYEHYLCGIIWQIFGMLMYHSRRSIDTMDSYIRPAISIMNDYYSYRITVPDIAAQLHISKGYFSEIFKQQTGISPKKYLNGIRMERAAERLRRGASVTDAAISSGFPDVFAFSRAFKQHYHCSPTEYIQAARATLPNSEHLRKNE